MADQKSLKLVGVFFAAITLAVMLTAAMMVKGHADGRYKLESASSVPADFSGSASR